MTRSTESTPVAQHVPTARPFRVLVIEDDNRLAEAYELYFEDVGYLTTSIARVDEALDQLAGPWPELVVSDFDLPDGTGFDIVRASSVPVFVCTGRGEERLHRALIEAGAWEVLVKPFSLPDLTCAMERAIAAMPRYSVG